jgi:hypothetical protein
LIENVLIYNNVLSGFGNSAGNIFICADDEIKNICIRNNIIEKTFSIDFEYGWLSVASKNAHHFYIQNNILFDN